MSRPLLPPCSRAVVAATASDAPPLQKTKCCFCNVSIERGKEHKLPLDDNGEARLPPDCARRAAAKGAAATGWLHNQAGKSCYNVVCKERSALREKARPTTRNGYEPGSAMPCRCSEGAQAGHARGRRGPQWRLGTGADPPADSTRHTRRFGRARRRSADAGCDGGRVRPPPLAYRARVGSSPPW